MMRGESAQQCTWRTLAEPSNDRKIEMADKKTKEENVCGTKEGLHRVHTGRDKDLGPVAVCLQSDRWKSFEICVNMS